MFAAFQYATHKRSGSNAQGSGKKFFATSKQNADQYTANILKENKLNKNSVVKDYLTTDADRKKMENPVPYLDNQH